MAQGEGFKHITVTAADEEDEVIVAGVPSTAAPVSEPEPASADGLRSEAPQPSLRPSAETGDEPAEQVDKPAAKPSKPRKDDAYHETTLEDLQGQPMPTAQRIVIIAAIVCIIGAIIYYFAFMG